MFGPAIFRMIFRHHMHQAGACPEERQQQFTISYSTYASRLSFNKELNIWKICSAIYKIH